MAVGLIAVNSKGMPQWLNSLHTLFDYDRIVRFCVAFVRIGGWGNAGLAVIFLTVAIAILLLASESQHDLEDSFQSDCCTGLTFLVNLRTNTKHQVLNHIARAPRQLRPRLRSRQRLSGQGGVSLLEAFCMALVFIPFIPLVTAGLPNQVTKPSDPMRCTRETQGSFRQTVPAPDVKPSGLCPVRTWALILALFVQIHPCVF